MKLKNKKHEAFAQAVACGMSATEAFRLYVSDKGAISSIMVSASRLRNTDKVRLRVQALQAKASDVLEKRIGFEKEDALRILVEIIETPVQATTKSSRLRERWSKTQHGEYIGMPSKMEALALMGKWCGWETMTKISVTANVEDFIGGILDALDQQPGLPTHE